MRRVSLKWYQKYAFNATQTLLDVNFCKTYGHVPFPEPPKWERILKNVKCYRKSSNCSIQILLTCCHNAPSRFFEVLLSWYCAY